MKLVACLFLLMGPAVIRTQQVKIGLIEYFGTKQVDVEKVKSSMPVHEGEQVSFDKFPNLIIEVKAAVKGVTAKEPTDVAPGCCDANGNWYIYIGLGGTNVQLLNYNPTPHGAIRFPPEIETLYQQLLDLNMEAVKTQASEDRSKGYAISSYPSLRAKQLAIRDYAIQHPTLIRRVLAESGEPEQRRVAAWFLGYTDHSRSQIDSLVKASRDPDETVRNNAVRALGVMAESSEKIAHQIPAKDFILMLNSGNWTDRNKGSLLLAAVTLHRDRKLLDLIRAKASDSLLEMARWRNYGHAYYSRVLLGRIAGINEKQLQKLAHDDVSVIIEAFVSTH